MRGSIRRRTKNSWELTIDQGRDPQGKRVRKFVNVRGKKADAERKLRELLNALDSGLPMDRSKMRVGDYLEQWLSSHASRVRPRTIYGYRNVLRRYVIPFVGTIFLNKLQPAHIEDVYTSQLDNGISPRTVLQTHRILKKALSQAVRWNMIGRNPSSLVDPPSFEKKETPVLSVDQLVTFLERAANSAYWPGFYLAAVTGMRRGELVGLKWEDIDFEHGAIAIKREIVFVPGEGYLITPPKSTQSRRSITISTSDVSELHRCRAYQAEQRLKLGTLWNGEGWVMTRDDGRHLNPSSLTNEFRAIRKELGLPPVNLHGLRHTHATIMLQQGVHLKVVQDRLGHSTIAITADTYSHVTSGLQKEAADAFESALRSGKTTVFDASV